MESSTVIYPLTFSALQARLLRAIRQRLDNGEFTERSLARLTGISQPQILHLLKGERRLTAESADILLAALQLSVLDLLTDEDSRVIEKRTPDVYPPRSFVSFEPL